MLRLNLKRHSSVPGLIEKKIFFEIWIEFNKFYDPRGLPIEKLDSCAKVGILIQREYLKKRGLNWWSQLIFSTKKMCKLIRTFSILIHPPSRIYKYYQKLCDQPNYYY